MIDMPMGTAVGMGHVAITDWRPLAPNDTDVPTWHGVPMRSRIATTPQAQGRIAPRAYSAQGGIVSCGVAPALCEDALVCATGEQPRMVGVPVQGVAMLRWSWVQHANLPHSG
jgi:hypothetical protein